MAVNVGTYSTTLTRDYRNADVKVSSISAPAASASVSGSVTITLLLQSYLRATGSVTLYYTQDGGQTLSACTITEAQTSLSCDSDGVSHSFTWNSLTDLGATNSFSNVQIAAVANDQSDGGGDDDKAFLSGAFSVDNTPTQPSWTSTDGDFGKSYLRSWKFVISNPDPGSEVLYPQVKGDLTTDFNSASLFTVDSQDGSSHDYFDHEVDDYSATKALNGYYVENLEVSGQTTFAFADLFDRFTCDALPSTITDARAMIVQRNGRRVFQVSISNTQIVLNESVSGQDDDGLCDIFIMSGAEAATPFFVKSGVSVSNTTPTNVTFSSMGNDDFGNDITDTFGAAPRIIVVDEVDRMAILGTITTTGVQLSKSASGAVDDAQVTLWILKTPGDIYLDNAVAVTETTLTERVYDDLTDSEGDPPAMIQGAIVVPVPTADRHVYSGVPKQDGVYLAQAVMGFADGEVDVNIFQQQTGDGTIMVPMLSTGIPDSYEGLNAQWRPIGTEFSGKGNWKVQVAFANEA